MMKFMLDRFRLMLHRFWLTLDEWWFRVRYALARSDAERSRLEAHGRVGVSVSV